MRFGRDFDDAKAPAWYQYYIDYNRLKYEIKRYRQASLTAKHNASEDIDDLKRMLLDGDALPAR